MNKQRPAATLAGLSAPPEQNALASDTAGRSAVVCSGLAYRFGAHTAVDGVDLRIEPGETFGLLGSNGAGKAVRQYG